jgi:hypothetical protein
MGARFVSSKYPSTQKEQVRYVAVDRGENARALEIHLRLAELSVGLRETRLGAHALRL